MRRPLLDWCLDSRTIQLDSASSKGRWRGSNPPSPRRPLFPSPVGSWIGSFLKCYSDADNKLTAFRPVDQAVFENLNKHPRANVAHGTWLQKSLSRFHEVPPKKTADSFLVIKRNPTGCEHPPRAVDRGRGGGRGEWSWMTGWLTAWPYLALHNIWRLNVS